MGATWPFRTNLLDLSFDRGKPAKREIEKVIPHSNPSLKAKGYFYTLSLDILKIIWRNKIFDFFHGSLLVSILFWSDEAFGCSKVLPRICINNLVKEAAKTLQLIRWSKSNSISFPSASIWEATWIIQMMSCNR